MTPITLWWILAGAAIVAELLTGTLYLLLLAAGLATGALAALLGASTASQLLLASAVAGALMGAWHLWRRQHPKDRPASQNPDVNLDLGQTVQVEHWQADGSATTHYRGAQWTVQLQAGQSARPGPQRIVEVLGSRLIVAPV